MKPSPSSLPEARPGRIPCAMVLGALAFLFLLRVLGQVLIVFFGVRFLPPMQEWYSGIIPYPILLPLQIVILLVQAWMCSDLLRGRGVFVRRRPLAGRRLRSFSYAYFVAMLIRYIVTMALHPERRWFGGTIPIVFHWVLAAYLYVYSRYLSAHRGFKE